MKHDPNLLAALERRWTKAFAKVRAARVLVAGSGGLGSNTAQCLARAGVGFLVLCDFDRVEATNLDRQFFFADQVGQFKACALADNLRRIGAGTELVPLTTRIDQSNVEEIISASAVVVEAFDDPVAKALLVNTAATCGKPVITASGIAGLCGNSFPRVRIVGQRLAVVGDETNAVCDALPARASKVAACAALQADLVLQWITEGCFGKNGNRTTALP